MSIQSFQAFFSANTPLQFVDPKSGALTKTGQYLMLQLWNRTGQGDGIIPSVSDHLTATGSTAGDALQLMDDWNFFGTVASGTGCFILPLKPGNDIEVYNGGAHSLKIYPPTPQDQIDALGAGVAYSLAPGFLRIFQCWAINPAQFYSYGN